MDVAERESLTQPSRWPFRVIRIRSSGDVAFLVSSALLLVFCFFAIWPQALATYDPTINNLGLRHEPPGVADTKGGPVHFLGTDHMGRDEWSRLVWGARASMTVGGLGLLLGAIVGVSVGLAAGFRGGWVDRISMRVVDIFLSFPYILIAIVWASLIGTDMKSLILIVGVRGWVEFARITRAQAMAIREREYITAARGLGIPRRSHRLPAHPAQHGRPYPGGRRLRIGATHPVGGYPLFPHHRHPATHCGVGKYAVRRPQLHEPSLVDGAVPRHVHIPHRHGGQLSGRQLAR